MEFHVMAWSGDGVLKLSVFGIVDKAATTGTLPPSIASGGIWNSYRTIHEDRFKFAAEAKKSIAERGYYLIGGELNITEIENSPLNEDENALPPWATPD